MASEKVTFGIKKVCRVNIKWNGNEEARSAFYDFLKEEEIYPCNRGGISGPSGIIALYSREDADRISTFLKRSEAHYTPLLNQY